MFKKRMVNNFNIDNLKKQHWDAYSGNGNGFTLTQGSLRKLNSKTNMTENQTTHELEPANVYEDEGRDSTTTWSMTAGEVYRVAFYFWLDGYSMTAETDTTVAKDISIAISAAQ